MVAVAALLGRFGVTLLLRETEDVDEVSMLVVLLVERKELEEFVDEVADCSCL